MPSAQDPWEYPDWHAVGREVALVRHLIGSGVTSLGRANYASEMGEYYSAFFGLSIGIERLSKLVLIVGKVVECGGDLSCAINIRQFGHEINRLLNAVEIVAINSELHKRRPDDDITKSIISCLDDFSNARKGRYANIDSMGSPNIRNEEPIQKWWKDVSESILKKHYYNKTIERRVNNRARVIHDLISPMSLVRFVDETGNVLSDVYSASARTGQTAIVQKYGRYYTLRIVRWLSEIYSELAQRACYEMGCNAFFGSWEHLIVYTADDSYFKNKKRWP